MLGYTNNAFSLEEIFTEDLDKVSFERSSNVDDSLPIYRKTIWLKILLKYRDFLSIKEIEPIIGKIKVKISILPDGTLNSVEFISPDINKETKDGIRHLIEMASPFNSFPNKFAKFADVFEPIYTFNSIPRKQSNKALHGIYP